jgi:hypothetical protein
VPNVLNRQNLPLQEERFLQADTEGELVLKSQKKEKTYLDRPEQGAENDKHGKQHRPATAQDKTI